MLMLTAVQGVSTEQQLLFWVLAYGAIILACLIIAIAVISIFSNSKNDKKQCSIQFINDESKNSKESVKDESDAFIDLLISYNINSVTETKIYGDTKTGYCYFIINDNKYPIYRSDGTIYSINELKPILEKVYNP